MKPGLSTLFLMGKPRCTMLNFIETHASECKAWELVDDGSLKLDERSIARLRQLSASFNLKFSLHAPFTDLNIASLNPTVQRLSVKAFKATMQKAYKVEAETVVIHPGFKGPQEGFRPGESWQLNIKVLRQLQAEAKNLGLTLALENMPKGGWPILSRVEDFERFYAEADVEDLGLALDVGHALTVGQLDQFLQKFSRRIVHIHLHSNYGDKDEHLGFGGGNLDWPGVITKLKEIGFSGFLMVEAIEKAYESFQAVKRMVEG